jgi:cysteine desulfuration protein SufE
MTITAMAVNGMDPSKVAQMEPDYADAMGVRSALTPSRANGFLNMFRRICEEAAMLV